jgi:hypothetical protein
VQTQSPGSDSLGNIITSAWYQGNSQELEPNLLPDSLGERIDG